MPSANAPSSSAGATATDLRKPSTSVNHNRTKRMSRSSSVRSTNSSCRSMSAFPHRVMGRPRAHGIPRRRATVTPSLPSPCFLRVTWRAAASIGCERAAEVVGVDYRFRPPTRRPEDNGAPPPRYRRDTADGMIIERDVAVGVRGGVTVYADVFRPADERPAPPLIAWSPYGKHAGSQVTERYPDGGVAPGQLSGYTAFESPDPLYWTARGYAVINADIPGSWHSGGNATFLSPEEAACGHDFIEWAAAQPWSNGKAGMSGVSYLTSAQWSIAATRPPHLAAINPWEGWSDTYREVARHGGIPETYFWPYIGQRWGCGTQLVEDLAAETAEHPLLGAFEGFKKISSPRKWLDAHGGKKWGYYYAPESLRRQQAFFDFFNETANTE